jgi:hypothetical protein
MAMNLPKGVLSDCGGVDRAQPFQSVMVTVHSIQWFGDSERLPGLSGFDTRLRSLTGPVDPDWGVMH